MCINGPNCDFSPQRCSNFCSVRARVAFLNRADRTAPERKRRWTNVTFGCRRRRWSRRRTILRLRASQCWLQRLHQSICESSQAETQLSARICLVLNIFVSYNPSYFILHSITILLGAHVVVTWHGFIQKKSQQMRFSIGLFLTFEDSVIHDLLITFDFNCF